MKIVSIILLSAFILCGKVLCASGNSKINTEVAFRAMQDEMNRSMAELSYEDYEKPFYISYSLVFGKTVNIAASLGALIKSDSEQKGFASMNLKVGNYQITDEKFADKTNKVNHDDGNAPLPIELDYLGIRRSFWFMTNNTYKNASVLYKNKLSLMKKHGFDDESMPSPDFSKEDVKQENQEFMPEEKDLGAMEQFIVDISKAFKENPEVINSEVSLKYQNLMYCFINTEGAKIQKPFRFYVIKVKAKVFDVNNRPIEQSMEYYKTSFSHIPSLQNMKEDVNILVDNLKACAQAPVYTESYTGPVLFTDNSVVDFHFSRMFEKSKGLIAQPRGLVNNNNRGLFYADYKTWEDMKGKRVMDKKLTINLTPFQNYFKSIPLIGYSGIDLDAIQPDDSICLVKDGILMEQIVGRIPTPSQHNSSGHMRFYVHNSQSYPKLGPSVVQITSSDKQSREELKKQMVSMATEEGLDYAFVVKTITSNADESPVNFYKYDINDGSEVLMRGLSYTPNVKSVKDVNGVGDGVIVQNILLPDYQSIKNKMSRYKNVPDEYKQLIREQIVGTQGTPTSFICPDALLIESAELSGKRKQVAKQQRVVSNPLVRK